MTLFSTLAAWWRWVRTPRSPAIPCVMSFDIADKTKWVVTVRAVSSRGVVYEYSPYIPHALIQYVRNCNNAMDFWMRSGDSLHYIFYDDALVVVAGLNSSSKPVVRVPYQEDGFRECLIPGVRLAKPQLHWDGHVPEHGDCIVVHPFWEGCQAVLLVSGEGYQNLLK